MQLAGGLPSSVDNRSGRVVEPALELLHGKFVLRHGYDCHARLTVDTAN
jgi:hypothetical protein